MNPTGNAIADQWLVLRRELAQNDELAPATVDGDEGILKNHFRPRFGDRTVGAISKVGVLAQWVREQKRKYGAKGVSTVRNIMNTVTGMFETALSEGWYEGANPMKHPSVRAQIPAPRTPLHRRRGPQEPPPAPRRDRKDPARGADGGGGRAPFPESGRRDRAVVR
jgi:hypothetical protein